MNWKKLSIDLNKWTTITNKAKSMKTRSGKGSSTQYISTLIRLEKLKSWKIDELGITLVEK